MRQARIRPDKTEKRFKRPTFSVTAYTDVRLFCQNKKTESRPGRFLKGKHNSPKYYDLKKSIDISLMQVRFLHGAYSIFNYKYLIGNWRTFRLATKGS